MRRLMEKKVVSELIHLAFSLYIKKFSISNSNKMAGIPAVLGIPPRQQLRAAHGGGEEQVEGRRAVVPRQGGRRQG